MKSKKPNLCTKPRISVYILFPWNSPPSNYHHIKPGFFYEFQKPMKNEAKPICKATCIWKFAQRQSPQLGVSWRYRCILFGYQARIFHFHFPMFHIKVWVLQLYYNRTKKVGSYEKIRKWKTSFKIKYVNKNFINFNQISTASRI